MKKIYTFSTQTNVNEWKIVNDEVMGGTSKSKLTVTNDGFGKFAGTVSLENNGGFASAQLTTSLKLEPEYKYLFLRVKGDKKRYEFRLKGDYSLSESYVHQFETSGNWQIIKLTLNEFEPQFRGRKLNISNFNYKEIEQLSFFIANKRNENFELQIDWIGLE